MSKSDPKSCNRQPFLSEAGCDRGNVDIHQFDDLPYCEPVNPTMPSIPPEIVDTPIELPVPPSCACVNIKYALNFKYSKDRKFAASASFSAQGDCCEGNYVSNFNLQIPCPIIGGGSKKIKMKIGYGTGKASVSASYIKANASSCTVEAKDVDINLNIPCPVKDARGKKIKIGISYGDGPKGASASFIKANTKDCEIEPLSPILHLNLPCPVIGRNDNVPKIRAKARFAKSGNSVSVSYIRRDVKECTIEPLSPTLNLEVPCPIKKPENKDPHLKIKLKYGMSGSSASVSYIKTDPSSCTIQPLPIDIRLNLPCPVRRKPGESFPKLRAKLGWGSSNRSASISFLKADSQSCLIKGSDVSLNLQLPCPIKEHKEGGVKKPPHMKLKIKYGSSSSSASVSYIKVNSSSCTIEPLPIDIRLNLPCPVRRKPGESFPKFRAKIGWGSSGSSVSSSFLTADSQSCRLQVVDKQFRLNLRCPFTVSTPPWVSLGNNKYRLRFKMKYRYQWATTYTSTPSASWLIVDKKECTITHYQPDIRLDIPCPFQISNNGWKKLRIKPKFKRLNNENAYQSADLFNLSRENCSITLKDNTYFGTVDLNVPCPTKKDLLTISTSMSMTSNSVGRFYIKKDSSAGGEACGRKITLKVEFPISMPNMDFIVALRYNQSKHALQVKKYNPKRDKGKTIDDLKWTDVFSAVSHKSDHVNCNDV